MSTDPVSDGWCETHDVPGWSCAERHETDRFLLEKRRADACEALLSGALADAERHATRAQGLRSRCYRLSAVLDLIRRTSPELVRAAEEETDRRPT